MKKAIILVVMSLLAITTFAGGGPKIKFEKTVHDFGNIKADGGRVTCDYEFTNIGNEPLLIINVTNGGCGCTTPSFPKKPIKPGESGKVTITFNPQGRRGEINRTVRVSTNGDRKSVKLKFTGVVLP